MAEIKHIYIGRAAPLLQGIEKLKRNEMREARKLTRRLYMDDTCGHLDGNDTMIQAKDAFTAGKLLSLITTNSTA